ncbi:MAG: precorrin-4 C(11)-methyltransferase [Crocinitomicaceae bacterium]|nr:precorrin-4 C(11)-methyltransferase [Crocinitomicaceae bacterium]
MKKVAFIAVTNQGIELALSLQKEYPKSVVVSTKASEYELVSVFSSIPAYLEQNISKLDGICFVSALGICVRTMAPFLSDKYSDPAVICVDDQGKNVQSVLSGHVGGANDFARKVAAAVAGNAIISTSSDVQEIWSLDTLANQFDWKVSKTEDWNQLISRFVNHHKTALLLDLKDKGTAFMEKSLPDFVTVYYSAEELEPASYDLIITVTYRQYDFGVPTVAYYPKSLSIGSGCSKELDPELFDQELKLQLERRDIALEAVSKFGSIDIKANQQAYLDFGKKNGLPFFTFQADRINRVNVPNPSEVVKGKIGVDGVSESTAMLMANTNRVLIEKQKIALDNGQKFTFAVAIDPKFERKSSIAIVGAGPGDEELITVKGKNLLEEADLCLYAGSLVPEEMTSWCKEGAVVRNSATMTLEEQIEIMQSHYKRGHSIVRLHSGDPSLYGAIQEQMSILDDLNMDYYIVPGISAFSAAAAILKSEFTIPEVVQSIVLTRGEGKTPMPSKESIEAFAKTNATMCIFLSAGIAKKVEGELLKHFDPDTPVAVMYRLTWKDEEVYQGKLTELAHLVKTSKKTRTVLMVVGKAIGARKNRSQLYSPDWKHIFRTNKKFVVTEDAS